MKRFGVGSALVLLLMVFLVGSVFSGNSDNDQGLGEDSAVVADLASLFTGLEIAPAYKPLGKHNPILPHRFGADPYALVYDGRVYVYATNDALFRTPKGTVIEN
ncbi:MAG: hypothetical protein QM399_09230, partial [Bacillota bacterium]|nr:hypothetical protein [Bacillota bacterium]